ncbi:MAG: hypothetical protein Q8O61_03415 [Nocardioides sp.]|nr:hypothetical protein [Nocardioides sp.]
MTYAPATHVATTRSPWAPVAVQVALVVGIFAAAGAGCGWLWFRLWDPPLGVVFEGKWYLDEGGLRGVFSGTGWFVAVAAGAGLVLGALCAYLFDRSELATLLAVSVGAALATFLMWRVGLSLSPADPHELARTAADGDRLPGRLEASGPSPFLVLPATALGALALAYAMLPKRDA